MLFTDVQDFTKFSAGAEAKEVVAALNRLFEVVVSPAGGHVDSSRAMACSRSSGRRSPTTTTRSRATRAAIGLPPGEQRGEAGDLRVGVGVNTGRVVAAPPAAPEH